MAGRHHRTAEHKRNAKAAVARANADPNYRCPRCGELARPGDPWEGGHPDGPDGRPNYSTPHRQAEHRKCNRYAGLLLGVANREERRHPHLEQAPRRTGLTWSTAGEEGSGKGR